MSEWVAYSAYSKAELLAPQVVPVPRFVRVRQEVAPPISLQGVSRYSRVGQHRCVVPDTLVGSSKEVLEAIGGLQQSSSAVAIRPYFPEVEWQHA